MAALENAGIDQQSRQPSKSPEKTGKGQHRGYERRTLETPSSFRRLGCTMRRNYGAIEIEFSVTGQFDVGSNDEQKRVLGMLYKQVENMHDEWALNELPHVKNVQPRKEDNAAGEYEADYIYWNTERVPERLMLITRGGKYSKYGAGLPTVLYEDFFKGHPSIEIQQDSKRFLKSVTATIDDSGVVRALKNATRG